MRTGWVCKNRISPRHLRGVVRISKARHSDGVRDGARLVVSPQHRVAHQHLEIFRERRDVGRVRGVIARQIVDQATRERNVREASIRPLEVKLRGPIGRLVGDGVVRAALGSTEVGIRRRGAEVGSSCDGVNVAGYRSGRDVWIGALDDKGRSLTRKAEKGLRGASLEDRSAREKDGGPHGGKQVNVWGDTDEDKREG